MGGLYILIASQEFISNVLFFISRFKKKWLKCINMINLCYYSATTPYLMHGRIPPRFGCRKGQMNTN